MENFLANFVRQSGVADPRNYRFLQEAAGNVLSRAVPGNVNWGGLPTNYLNTLDQINQMPPGAAKEAARTAAKNTLTRASVQVPSQPPISTAGPGGMLRAPVIGTPSAPGTVLSQGPTTQIPGSPLQFDPALRRQFGWTGGAQQVANKLIPKGSATGANLSRAAVVNLADDAINAVGSLSRFAGPAAKVLGPIGVVAQGYEVGKKVFNPQDNIITNIQSLSTGIGNLLQGRNYLDSTPGKETMAEKAAPRGARGGQGRGLRFNRGQASPDVAAPGSAQETGMYGRYIPGSAQDRAYMQEASRVAQLTAQDPELKRYADARELAVAPGATPAQVQSAEDIGMAIWAQKYGQPGGLARAVKPGQAGYDVIQQTLIGQDAGNAARQGMGYQAQSQMIPTPPPGLGAPQGLPSVNMQPTYGAGGLEVDPERLKKFQALINQAKE